MSSSKKVDGGNKKSIERAIQTAVEEKSRYVAERIARTEAARARYDAFTARYGEDEDVVAYQWKLGSRHPAEDICDMYAHADLYGLGKGVFPKDAAPASPAHPHCLCHYAPVYQSELEGKKRSDDVEAGGNAWLKKESLSVQEKILGVKGREEWKAGKAGWMKKVRNFNTQAGEYCGIKSRLHRFMNKIMGRSSSPIVLEDLPKIKENLSVEENALKTNPNYYSDKKGAEYYRVNCQKCVPAFELRMRGYDVQAKWFDKSNSNSNEKWLVEHPFSAFLRANIKTIFSGVSAYGELSDALQGYGAGARIEIAILNEETLKGHVIVGCNEYNKIKFLDVQTGKSFSFEGLNDNINIKYARIDILKIDTEILSDICDWR